MLTVFLLLKSLISGSTPGVAVAASAAGAISAAATADAAGRRERGEGAAANGTGEDCCCYLLMVRTLIISKFKMSLVKKCRL